MTKDLFILVDGAGWHNFDRSFPYPLYKGLVHGKSRSPYRNVLYGLEEIVKRFPNFDWYCYMESDCLVVSDIFKQDLMRNAGRTLGGVHYRGGNDIHLPLLNEIVGATVNKNHYLLGATQFFAKKFVYKLLSEDIPKKILRATNNFPSDFFPDFGGFAFEEELFPMLANHYFPNSVFNIGEWSRYNMRWQPDIRKEEVSHGAAIIHPLKSYDDPIRLHYKKFRDKYARHQ